jgi:hypothetical protein
MIRNGSSRRSEWLVGVNAVAISFHATRAFWGSKIATVLCFGTSCAGSAKRLAH